MIRIFINNILASEGVIGLANLSEELELKKEIYGYLYQVSGSLTFIGADYDYFRTLYDAAYCQDVDIDIQYSPDGGNTWDTKIKALIKVISGNWDLVKRQVEFPIIDNSYQSKINNNRLIDFQLGNHTGILLSKNGVDVVSKLQFNPTLQMFSPFLGTYFYQEANFTDGEGQVFDSRPAPRVGMFIWDALNVIIAMMTDDEVDFASDYFTYDINAPLDFRAEAFAVIVSGGKFTS